MRSTAESVAHSPGPLGTTASIPLMRKRAGIEIDCPLAVALAGRLRRSREDIVERWLERISARVNLDANRIFPSDDLIDHVPLLVSGIADYIEDPADEISADVPVLAKALELGQMRHEQGFDLHEILKEYELLGGILHHFIQETIGTIEEPCTAEELVACTHRLFRAVSLIQQVTATEYMRREQARVADREQTLRGFNRALSHEIRSRIGAVQSAVDMLDEDFILEDPALRRQFRGIAKENSRQMIRVIENLIELSRSVSESRRQRHILLRDSVAETVRQLRQFASARKVAIHVGDLPEVEVPAAILELALSNYVSNAIKYHDPEKAERWVQIRGAAEDGEIRVEVADNGTGVPEDSRAQLFQRFFRADHTVEEVEGTGLGLSIVKEAVESVGGRAWADFSENGETRFIIGLPARRLSDQ